MKFHLLNISIELPGPPPFQRAWYGKVENDRKEQKNKERVFVHFIKAWLVKGLTSRVKLLWNSIVRKISKTKMCAQT